MSIQVKDAEAAIYAIEASAQLWLSVASSDWSQAALDAVSLIGWVRNMF